MGLIEARRARDERLLNISAGGSGRIVTLEQLAEAWMKDRRIGRVSDSTLYYSRLRLSYLSALMPRAAWGITRVDLVAALRALAAERSAETARRTAMVVKMVFDYGVDMGGLTDPHPAVEVFREAWFAVGADRSPDALIFASTRGGLAVVSGAGFMADSAVILVPFIRAGKNAVMIHTIFVGVEFSVSDNCVLDIKDLLE